jgi:hypothetical protein
VVTFTPRPLYPQGRKNRRYPLDRRLGGSQGQSGQWRREKSLTPAVNQTSAVQPIACLYTDYAIPALNIGGKEFNIIMPFTDCEDGRWMELDCIQWRTLVLTAVEPSGSIIRVAGL